MPNKDPNKIGNLAEPEIVKDVPLDRGYVLKLTDHDREYFSQRNPLLGYRVDLNDKADRVAKVIEHVTNSIQHRIDRGERYFTEYSKHKDLLEMRSAVIKHFQRLGIDLNIRRGGYIFVCNRGQQP